MKDTHRDPRKMTPFSDTARIEFAEKSLPKQSIVDEGSPP